jgi:hypothetical protein
MYRGTENFVFHEQPPVFCCFSFSFQGMVNTAKTLLTYNSKLGMGTLQLKHLQEKNGKKNNQVIKTRLFKIAP